MMRSERKRIRRQNSYMKICARIHEEEEPYMNYLWFSHDGSKWWAKINQEIQHISQLGSMNPIQSCSDTKRS
jgi:hypothetical protein